MTSLTLDVVDLSAAEGASGLDGGAGEVARTGSRPVDGERRPGAGRGPRHAGPDAVRGAA